MMLLVAGAPSRAQADTPTAFAVEADGTTALVITDAIPSQRKLERLDLTSFKSKAILATHLNQAAGVAIESGGLTALVTEFDRLTRVDLATGTKTTIATGLHSPTALFIETGGLTAVVAQTNRVTRVTLADGALQHLTSALNTPRGLVPEAGGATALVVDDLLHRINLTTGALTTLATTTTTMENSLAGPIAIESGGTTALAMNIAGRLLRINLANGTSSLIGVSLSGNATTMVIEVGGTVLVDGYPRLVRVHVDNAPSAVAAGFGTANDIAIMADGVTALLVEEGGFGGPPRLLQVNLTTGATSVITTIASRFAIAGVFIEPGEATALVAGDAAHLIRVNLADGATTNVTSFLNGSYAHMVASPTSGHLLVHAGGLLDVDLTTGSVTTIVSPVGSGGIALEPGGQTALVTLYSSEMLMRINTTTGEYQTLFDDLSPIGSTRGEGAAIVLEASGVTALLSQPGTFGTGSGRLIRLDLTTGAVEVLVGVGLAGHGTYNYGVNGIAIEPGGLTAVLADYQNGVVRVNLPLARPSITSQPAALTVNAGTGAAFSVTAVGPGTLNYQWRHDGVVLPGETASTLDLTDVQAGDIGDYDVVVTNSSGSIASAAAALSLPIAPTITTDPVDTSVAVSGTAQFTVAADGLPAPTFHWQESTDGGTSWSDLTEGTPYAGTASTTLSVTPPATTFNGYRYRAVAANSAGDATSTAAVLGVTAPASFILGPDDTSVAAGSEATFTVMVAGLPIPTIQWEMSTDGGLNWGFLMDTPPFRGTATTTLAVTPSYTAFDSYRFRAVATNASGSASSPAAILSVTPPPVPPTIDNAPVDRNTTSGGNATFSVTASGYPTPTVQWQVSTNNGTSWSNLANSATYAGATATTLTITGGTAGMSGYQYRAVLTNSAGSVATEGVALTIGGRLVNISARAQVGTGGDVLIPGLVVAGTGTKRLLIRAIGPGLLAYGVTGVLEQPVLTVFNGSTEVASNTGWMTNDDPAAIVTANDEVQAFALNPASADSALLVDLGPGLYTAKIAGLNDTTGVALTEIYEVEASTARLVNISCRAQVGIGGDVLIPGLVVNGAGTKRLLIRAIGPGLLAYGVTGVLAQPVLTIYNGDTPVATNTGWMTNIDPAAIVTATDAVQAFPLDPASADCALLIDLPAGLYTAKISGLNATTGVALAEVYEVQ